MTIILEKNEVETVKKALFTRSYLEKISKEHEDEDIRGMVSNILLAVDEEYSEFTKEFEERRGNVQVSEESSVS